MVKMTWIMACREAKDPSRGNPLRGANAPSGASPLRGKGSK